MPFGPTFICSTWIQITFGFGFGCMVLYRWIQVLIAMNVVLYLYMYINTLRLREHRNSLVVRYLRSSFCIGLEFWLVSSLHTLVIFSPIACAGVRP